MRANNRDIGVAEVERRRGKRILTLRNTGKVALVALVIFVGLNIRSEMRDTTGASEEYGRLYGREMKKASFVTPVAPTPAAAEPVDEAASADPYSLSGAAREQYLGNPTLEPLPLVPVETAPAIASAVPERGSNVRIVGGPEGVTLLQENAQRAPTLGGGFGRR